MDFLNDTKLKQQISDSLKLLKDVLDKDLLGIYLYGSSVVGGLQKYSDLDLFAVSRRPTTKVEKSKLISMLLEISGTYPSQSPRPIELILVVKTDVNPWHFPPKFDFLYGDWLRKDFETGNIDPWSNKVRPDLALIITQVLLSSKTLFGNTPDQLLERVPYKDFMIATTRELDSLMANLNWDTRNVLLTFARIWSTVETDVIHSKPDAADWAIKKLPLEMKSVMERAKSICLGEKRDYWDDINPLIQTCAELMVNRIKKKTEDILSGDYKNRSIKYSD